MNADARAPRRATRPALAPPTGPSSSTPAPGNLSVLLAREVRDLALVESSREACEAARANLAARGLTRARRRGRRRRVRVGPDHAPGRARSPAHRRPRGRRAPRRRRASPTSSTSRAIRRRSGATSPSSLPRTTPRSIAAFEMFPQTSHVETVVALERAGARSRREDPRRRPPARRGRALRLPLRLRRLRALRRARASAARSATPPRPRARAALVPATPRSSSARRSSSAEPPMPRTHPPTLITLARAALRDHALVPRGVARPRRGQRRARLDGPPARARAPPRPQLALRALRPRRRPRPAPRRRGGARSRRGPSARSLDVPFTRSRGRRRAGRQPPGARPRPPAGRRCALRHRAPAPTASPPATTPTTAPRRCSCACSAAPAPRGLAVPPARRRRPDPALLPGAPRRHRRPRRPPSASPTPSTLRTAIPAFCGPGSATRSCPQLERLSPRIVEHLCALADQARTYGEHGACEDPRRERLRTDT